MISFQKKIEDCAIKCDQDSLAYRVAGPPVLVVMEAKVSSDPPPDHQFFNCLTSSYSSLLIII